MNKPDRMLVSSCTGKFWIPKVSNDDIVSDVIALSQITVPPMSNIVSKILSLRLQCTKELVQFLYPTIE